MTRLLGVIFSLLLFISCPVLADGQRADAAEPEIVYVDVVGSEPIQMMGKRLQFKLREGLPAPLPCAAAYCSKDNAAKERNVRETPEPAQGEADK